jgi:hypothetical protein
VSAASSHLAQEARRSAGRHELCKDDNRAGRQFERIPMIYAKRAMLARGMLGYAAATLSKALDRNAVAALGRDSDEAKQQPWRDLKHKHAERKIAEARERIDKER